MSVQNQTVKNVYVGNGSTTVFPYTFDLLTTDGAHVGVYVTNDDGVSEPTDNFEIDTTAKTVTYPKTGAALPSDKKIVIRREIPNEQELNLVNGGEFFADDIEGEMDREVMMVQQLQEEVDRAIKVDMASGRTADEVLASIYRSEVNAKNSANSAAASATAALASKNAAAESARKAKESEEHAYRITPEALKWMENFIVGNDGKFYQVINN